MAEEKSYSVIRTTAILEDIPWQEGQEFKGTKTEILSFEEAMEDPDCKQYLMEKYDLVNRGDFVENFKSKKSLGPRIFAVSLSSDGKSGYVNTSGIRKLSGIHLRADTIFAIEISEDLLPEISEDMGKVAESIKQLREQAKKRLEAEAAKKAKQEERKRNRRDGDLKRAIALVEKNGKKVVET